MNNNVTMTDIDRSLTPGDRLFIQTGSQLAWLNQAFQGFGDFADCYQNCALTLIDGALQDRSQRDYNIYPILFLIRHYVELRLKELIQGANYLDNQSADFPTGHKLQKLWNIFKIRYSEVIENLEPGDPVILIINDLIDEISGLDPNSMTFRYPVDFEGNRIPKPEYINLQNLRQVFISLCMVLDGMAMQISHYTDSIDDMTYEAYRYYQ